MRCNMQIKIINKRSSETNMPFQVLIIGNKGKYPYNQYTFKTDKERSYFIKKLKNEV